MACYIIKIVDFDVDALPESVIAEFKNSKEVDIALSKLKDIYVDIDKVDDYFKYVESLGGIVDVSVAEQDSLIYASAEKLYMSGDCEKSKDRFKNYITKFSNGTYITNAHFYKAECEYKDGNTSNAIDTNTNFFIFLLLKKLY